jgi:hypothetical protein
MIVPIILSMLILTMAADNQAADYIVFPILHCLQIHPVFVKYRLVLI